MTLPEPQPEHSFSRTFTLFRHSLTVSMARKTASRLSKRREVEAAEAQGATTSKKKRTKAAKKKAPARRKIKTAERKRLVWGVFSSSLKEEARFPYDQRKEAEKKLKALLEKGKRMYFLQPIKEVITDSPAKAATKEPEPEIIDDETSEEQMGEEE